MNSTIPTSTSDAASENTFEPSDTFESRHFATVEEAIAELQAGRFILITDDENPGNVGNLLMAGQFVDARAINWMLRRTTGTIRVPMEGARLDELQLPAMTEHSSGKGGTAYTISVDAAQGITRGVGASDRARTVAVLTDPASGPKDLVRPGHMLPLRAREGGVLTRAGHTEAAVDFCHLAGLLPTAIICEVVDDEGEPAKLPYLIQLAREANLKLVTVESLIAYRRQHEKLVRRVASARLPTEFGEFRAVAYESTLDGTPYIALVKGDIVPDEPTLVRVHSGCLTGDALLSLRCDCGEQLHEAMSRIEAAGNGVLLYVGQHEGRGIGIINKLRAYALQDQGADTEQANHALGFASDAREYGIGAQVLADLGVRKMRLLTNNPAKRVGMEGYGLQIVERVPLRPTVNAENRFDLETKQNKMGHLGLLDELDALIGER